MKIHMSLVPLFFLLLTVLQPSPDMVRQTQLEGLNVTMTLEQRSPVKKQANWPDEPVTLSVKTFPVNGKTIALLLLSNRIFPDAESYGVVYALNPEIKALDKLTDRQISQIRLPVVEGGPGLQKSFQDGFRVFLSLDKELKDRLVANIREIAALTQTASGFGPEKFEDSAARQPTLDALKSMKVSLDGINDRIIQRYGRPVPTEVLSRLNAEVELLKGVLAGKAAQGVRISREEQQQIIAISNDIATMSKSFVEVAAGGPPDRWPEVNVVVQTLRGSTAVPALRVYYVPVALKARKILVRSFGVLSSPATQSIPEGDFCFWAARDPQQIPVTNEQCFEVRVNRPANVQLTVNP